MKLRGLYYLIIIFFMGNLSSLTDMVFHPEIPYFDREHLVVGGTTALFTFVLFAFMETSILKEYGKSTFHLTSSKIGRRYGWPLAAIWTIIVISSLGWNIILHKQRTLKIALIEAKTIYYAENLNLIGKISRKNQMKNQLVASEEWVHRIFTPVAPPSAISLPKFCQDVA